MPLETKKTDVYQIGFYSAFFSTVLVILFALSLIFSLWVPSEMLDMLSFASSFILAPFFIAMMISIHYFTKAEKRIWSHLGVVFSIIYAVMITITYYIQLTVIRTNPLNLSEEILEPFIYSNVGSVIFAIDILGYAFMTLATLVTAMVFSRNGLEKWIQRLFVLNGLFFIPTIAFPLLLSPQIVSEGADFFGVLALLVWSIIFIPTSGLVTIFFKKLKNDRKSNT